ncbi:hypothetical protein [Salibacterium sp. K-3]
MDNRVKEWVETARETLGLQSYYLYDWHFRREATVFDETRYILGMEWFPLHAEGRTEEELNPEGTAVVEMDVTKMQWKSIVFVGGVSHAEELAFYDEGTAGLVRWVEKITGISGLETFECIYNEGGKYRFQEMVNGIPVTPGGWIDIQCNEKGWVTLFAMEGPFASSDIVRKETFTLALSDIEWLTERQLKRLDIPEEGEKKIYPVYGVEEIYVLNDSSDVLPFPAEIGRETPVHQILEWSAPLETALDKKPVDMTEEVEAAQVFSEHPHPDTFPITGDEKDEAVRAVHTMLRQEHPEDSGRWLLQTLYPEKGYIMARLTDNTKDYFIFPRRLKIVIDREQLIAVNEMDSEWIRSLYDEFAGPQPALLTGEEALEKIRARMTLTPEYVYDFSRGQYRLCGKLDAPCFVHAERAEIIEQNDIHFR